MGLGKKQTTQSHVSKQVAALERELGAKLLSRTTRSLALTEAGERYFTQARRLVAEIAEAEMALHEGEQKLNGWLRVAASVGYGRLKLLPEVPLVPFEPTKLPATATKLEKPRTSRPQGTGPVVPVKK